MLSNVLQIIGEGTNTQNREQQLRYANIAARELWTKYDLNDSCGELEFTLSGAPHYITLPWYVWKIRGIADKHTLSARAIRSPYAKFQVGNNNLFEFEWEIVRKTPLHTPLSTTTQLVADLVLPLDTTQTITIAGPTAAASFVEETLTFEPGELIKTTQFAFTGNIQRITKNGITPADVLIRQATNNAEVAMIPNRFESGECKVVKVARSSFSSGTIVLYFKRPFTPLYYDNDVFIDADMEQVLVWKARAYKASLSSEKAEYSQKWMMLEQKAQSILSGLMLSDSAGQHREVQVAPERLSPRQIMVRRCK